MSYAPVEIYLNSKYASFLVNGTYNSDLLFYFNQPVIKPANTRMRLKLVNFVMPVSFYLINSSNDTLVIDSTTYKLTHGNYTATTLKTLLQTTLPDTFSIYYDSATNKYTFENSLYGGEFTISEESTCLTLLGFSESDHTSSSYTLTSDQVVNLSGQYNVIYVSLPSVRTSNLSSTTGMYTSVLKSIPVPVTLGSVLYYEDLADASYTNIDDDSISFFHVRLLGEDLTTPIDLNGQDWNMTLQVSFEPIQNQTETQKMNFSDTVYRSYLTQLAPSQAQAPN